MIQSSSRSNRSISHGYLFFLIFFSFFVFTSLLIFPFHEGQCAQVTLAWDPDSLSDLAGYKIYYGTAPGNYQWSVDVGNVTTHTISDLAIGETYYAVATAYITSGLESTYSNEVMFTVASSTHAISTSSTSFPASGGTGSVTVTAPSGVAWSVTESLDWLTITSGSSGIGMGTVTFSVSPCAGSGLQVGTMMVADQTFTVTQFCSGIMPVYRFFNTIAGGHFYTIDEAEKNTVIQNYKWFRFEGIGFYASPTEQPGTLPVYRFFNTNAGGHFYTIDEAEKNTVIQNYKWFRPERIGFYAYPTDSPIEGDWRLIVDWGCDGSTTGTQLNINANGDFYTGDGYSGIWSLTGNQVALTVSNGTLYTGTMTGNHMEGFVKGWDGTTGCWASDMNPS